MSFTSFLLQNCEVVYDEGLTECREFDCHEISTTPKPSNPSNLEVWLPITLVVLLALLMISFGLWILKKRRNYQRIPERSSNTVNNMEMETRRNNLENFSILSDSSDDYDDIDSPPILRYKDIRSREVTLVDE